jgi:hypothetical protein
MKRKPIFVIALGIVLWIIAFVFADCDEYKYKCAVDLRNWRSTGSNWTALHNQTWPKGKL